MEERVSGFCFSKVATKNNGRGGGTKGGRWNPTAEQVRVLTDLFRAGLRTPSTDQIQKISAQLSFYGKIESKNVFYWFQNHKARERQKRRKVSVRDDGDKNSMSRRDDRTLPLPSKRFEEINDVGEPERVIETLQLFPLHPYEDSEMEKRKLRANDHCKESAVFSYNYGEEMNHLPLDLRLSFM